MAAGLSRASTQENVSTSLTAGITDVAATMTVADATKLQSPTYVVIDRVDSSGTLKPTSLWEYVKVTAIVGADLTITRGQGGSTQQAHSSGAIVEAIMTAAHNEEYFAAINPEHTATGTHVISTATVNYTETKRLAVTSIASIAQLNVGSLVVPTYTGMKGQFVWTQPGSLVTSLATAAGDNHLPFLRASKNLTLTGLWAGVNSAASLTYTELTVQYRSTPTDVFAELLTTRAYIDIGEYTTDSAATVATLALTSLASGTLLYPSIVKSGAAGDLTLTLMGEERA